MVSDDLGSDDPVDEAVALHDQAVAWVVDGRLGDAVAAARDALERLEAACGPDHPDVANVLLTLAVIAESQGNFAAAREAARRAAAVMERWAEYDEPDLVLLRVNALVARSNQDRIAGDLGVAEAGLLQALALAEDHFGADDPVVPSVLNALGVVYKYAARFDEGEAAYRRALDLICAGPEPDSLARAGLHHNLGGLCHARSRPEEGIEWAEAGLALREQSEGPAHLNTAADLGALGALYEQAGRLDDAEAAYRRALAVFEAALGPDHYEVGVVCSNLGSVLAERPGRAAEAEAAYRRGLALKEAALGTDHPDVALTLHNLGVLLADQGRSGEARDLLLRAEDIVTRRFAPDHPRVAAARAVIASLGLEARGEEGADG